MQRLPAEPCEGQALALVYWLAIVADRLRGRILGYTLRFSLIRSLFYNRSARLAVIFLAAFPLNLALAVFLPMWTLLLGPLLLGIPHLVASSAYVSRCAARRDVAGPSVATLAGGCFLAVALIRSWANANGYDTLGMLPNWVELAAAGLCFLWLANLATPSATELLTGLSLLGGLVLSSIAFPFWTLGILVLAHNGVAFVYWLRRARSNLDRQAAIFASGLFCLGTAAILAGLFDGVARSAGASLSASGFDVATIGQSIFPGADSVWWPRAVMAYAFGQSQHYIVWLKALPEQDLPRQHPIGFSKSARLFKLGAGRLLLFAAAYGVGALFAYACWAGLHEARALYLAGAIFHGYFEIAGLAFIRKADLDHL
jgi:hypothetical protein